MVSRLLVAIFLLLIVCAVVGLAWGLWLLIYPQIWLLHAMRDELGAWGPAILATAALRYLFAWLLQHAGKPSPKLEPLRAEAAAIKQQHVNDPQLKDRKLLEMYQRHDVTGWTFARTILIMPIVAWTMIGLGVALWKLTELRGARFLWIPDLSARDPLYVLPLVHAVITALSALLRYDWTAKLRHAAMVSACFIWILTGLLPASWLLAWIVDMMLSLVLRSLRFLRIKHAARRSDGLRSAM